MVIPDPLQKTVLIPARMQDGKLSFLYGGEFPAIADGTVVDVIVPCFAVKDEDRLAALQRTSVELFLPRGTHVLAQVRPRDLSREDRDRLEFDVYWHPPGDGCGVRVVLEDDLRIRLRGTKKAELEPCKCVIPCLDDAEATSLNEAYYQVSKRFEAHRKSNSGNVFDKIYFEQEKGPWLPLGELRSQFEARFEQQLAVLWREWWHQGTRPSVHDYWVLAENQPAGAVQLHIITSKAVIVGELPFLTKAEAVDWLRAHGYTPFRWMNEVGTMPPSPPFIGRDGVSLELGICSR